MKTRNLSTRIASLTFAILLHFLVNPPQANAQSVVFGIDITGVQHYVQDGTSIDTLQFSPDQNLSTGVSWFDPSHPWYFTADLSSPKNIILDFSVSPGMELNIKDPGVPYSIGEATWSHIDAATPTLAGITLTALSDIVTSSVISEGYINRFGWDTAASIQAAGAGSLSGYTVNIENVPNIAGPNAQGFYTFQSTFDIEYSLNGNPDPGGIVSITIVPEPSTYGTYAAVIVGVVFSFAAIRRKK